MLEETPSGNLNLLRPKKPPVKITKEHVQTLTEVFEILDRWDREERAARTERARCEAHTPKDRASSR